MMTSKKMSKQGKQMAKKATSDSKNRSPSAGMIKRFTRADPLSRDPRSKKGTMLQDVKEKRPKPKKKPKTKKK